MGSEARKKVYDSVQLTTGGIVVCLWMASYTVLMADGGSTAHNTQELNERPDEWEMRQTGRRQGICGMEGNKRCVML